MNNNPFFSVRVRVPATTANLGSGFDVLGLALSGLYNEFELNVLDQPTGKKPTTLFGDDGFVIDGEGETALPRDKENLIFRSVLRVAKPSGGVTCYANNKIPLDRGLGSSSAAIVSGLVVANDFNASLGKGLSREDLLTIAAQVEGHPDNVAPALFGGLCVSVMDGKNVKVSVWNEPRFFGNLRAVVCVPAFELSTKRARAVLPDKVDRCDAIFNVSRTALFLSAFKDQRWDLLSAAMDDRLHQPYRKKLVPGFDDVLFAAKKNGAWGACLSGAGPSILAFSSREKAGRVGRAMCAAFENNRIDSKFLDMGIDLQGARIFSTNKRKQG